MNHFSHSQRLAQPAASAAPTQPGPNFTFADGVDPATRDQVVDALAAEFSRTAAERDAAGGTAKRERDLIRASGLLLLTIPEALGGSGADWNTTLHVVRRLAAADSSLAHLFAFHHLMLATLRLFGGETQWQELSRQTAENNWFWGNALNPLDSRSEIRPAGEGFVLNGAKSFCSGATDSDRLIISALHSETRAFVVAAIPTLREGIRIHDDWDNIGQRQTDSGTVSFDQVYVAPRELLRDPGPLSTPYATLRSTLAQLILTNIYLGLAEGALQHARAYVLDLSRPGTVGRVGDDPYLLRNFGELWVDFAGARALTDEAQLAFQYAWDVGPSLTAETRGQVAVASAAAKVASARASLSLGSRIFEVMGARATAAAHRFDRFWRNARTHTLHDPVDYKLKELGVWAVHGVVPTPSFYS